MQSYRDTNNKSSGCVRMSPKLCLFVTLSLPLACSAFSPIRYYQNGYQAKANYYQIRNSLRRNDQRLSHLSQSTIEKSNENEITNANGKQNGDDSMDNIEDKMMMSNLNGGPSLSSTSRLQKLKDRMWARETLEDLTAAEFACSLDATTSDEDDDKPRKTKRAVDFEALLAKLDRRLLEICVQSRESDENNNSLAESEGAQCLLPDEMCKVLSNGENCFYYLVPDKGMGCFVYSTEQREALLNRIVKTRKKLAQAAVAVEETVDMNTKESDSNDLEEIRRELKRDAIRGEGIVDDMAVEKMINDEDKNVLTKSLDPIMYVRDDGSIDWDGALQNRDALQKFGTSVWARINGQNPEAIDDEIVDQIEQGKQSESNVVTAKVMETEVIRAMKEKLDKLETSYKKMEIKHTALLNSGVSPGTATANVNLAILEPELRAKIRESALALEKKEDEVSFQRLNYELERIFVYLEGEVGNTSIHGYIPLQDRLAVAEFGLLESQVNGLNSMLEEGDVIDADVLAVVVDQVTDLKRRLGIDYYVTGLTYDSEAIKRWLSDLWINVKKGSSFYAKGCVLLWNDIAFCLSLFGRAIQGYTLKPREVRTLRRTFKDIITFIPVVIILLIPLSPVGHVFVFGAIQRFFPDFFPSCFSERRQNMLQLYESTEYSELTIKESLEDRIVRASEAFAYVLADNINNFYKNLTK